MFHLSKTAIVATLFVSALAACEAPPQSGVLTFHGECLSTDQFCDDLKLEVAGEETAQVFRVTRDPIATSDDFVSASVITIEGSGLAGIQFAFSEDGAKRFADASRARVGKIIVIAHGGTLLSAPIVREVIEGGQGQIFLGSVTQARDLLRGIGY